MTSLESAHTASQLQIRNHAMVIRYASFLNTFYLVSLWFLNKTTSLLCRLVLYSLTCTAVYLKRCKSYKQNLFMMANNANIRNNISAYICRVTWICTAYHVKITWWKIDAKAKITKIISNLSELYQSYLV